MQAVGTRFIGIVRDLVTRLADRGTRLVLMRLARMHIPIVVFHCLVGEKTTVLGQRDIGVGEKTPGLVDRTPAGVVLQTLPKTHKRCRIYTLCSHFRELVVDLGRNLFLSIVEIATGKGEHTPSPLLDCLTLVHQTRNLVPLLQSECLQSFLVIGIFRLDVVGFTVDDNGKSVIGFAPWNCSHVLLPIASGSR